MFTTSQPAALNQRDSALLEKRGPWITTTVPPSTTGISSSVAASTSTSRRLGAIRLGRGDVGGLRPVVERVLAAAGAVHELVGHHECARPEVRLERSAGARAEDPGHAQLAHRPDVGPVVDPVRRQLVFVAVARHEGHARALDLADAHVRGRRPVRGRDRDFLHVVEEAIEAGAPEHANRVRRPAHVPGGVQIFARALARSASSAGEGDSGAGALWPCSPAGPSSPTLDTRDPAPASCAYAI